MKISSDEMKFVQEALSNYNNPHCLSFEEFYEDFSRVKSVIRLFTKYKKTGVLNDRLIMNHLIILYNVFENYTTEMLFKKVPKEYFSFLKPFLIIRGCLPDYVGEISTVDIVMDKLIVERLRSI